MTRFGITRTLLVSLSSAKVMAPKATSPEPLRFELFSIVAWAMVSCHWVSRSWIRLGPEAVRVWASPQPIRPWSSWMKAEVFEPKSSVKEVIPSSSGVIGRL